MLASHFSIFDMSEHTENPDMIEHLRIGFGEKHDRSLIYYGNEVIYVNDSLSDWLYLVLVVVLGTFTVLGCVFHWCLTFFKKRSIHKEKIKTEKFILNESNTTT